MNGFNSKVVCKSSSITIWEILFNITIPITRGGFVKQLEYAPPPGRTQRGVNENVSPGRSSASLTPSLDPPMNACYALTD